LRVFLAPSGRCSFLSTGSFKIEWDAPDWQQKPAIWNYAVNFTGDPCGPYGGATVEQAARNMSNGLWAKGGDGYKNCA
jgi:hypothetical protein